MSRATSISRGRAAAAVAAAFLLAGARGGAAGPVETVVVALGGPTVVDLVLPVRGLGAEAPPPGAWAGPPRPGASYSTPTRADVDAAAAAVARGQAPYRTAVIRAGGRIISTYDSAANGFLAQLPAGAVTTVAALPGVTAVMRAPVAVPLLANAVPLIGADAVAAELGYDGQGVNVAVVDTGVDYTHGSFGGSGDATDYFRNNPGVVEAGSFPTAKVIGGYDFAGSSYGAGRPPDPDDDPLDEQGHGTHVAGIVAGEMVNPAVYHGVAPGARLVALKIFGRSGATNLVVDAIEWAIEANLGAPVPGAAARVDVLNMSLGSPWSEGVVEELGAVERATRAGIVVVASAGNSGDVGFVTGSPAAAPLALSVASTMTGGGRGDKIEAVHEGQTRDIEAREADPSLAPRPAGEIRGPLAWFGRGCLGDTPQSIVAGRVALIERGVCTFHEKLSLAEDAGAVAAVVFTDDRPVVVMGSEAGSVAIPAVMIGRGDGLTLRDQAEGSGVEVVLSAAFRGALTRTNLTDVISGFSSRGPARTGAVKPNIAAPGSAIVAPAMASGTGGVSLSGTSMASPMVAGAAAVLVQRLRADGLAAAGAPLGRRGGLSATDAAAMLVNTAGAGVWATNRSSGIRAPLARGGAGRVELGPAVRGSLLMTGMGAEAFALNLGLMAFRDTHTATATAYVHNLAQGERRVAIEAVALAPGGTRGITLSVVPEDLTLGAGDGAAVTLTAVASAAEMIPYPAHGGGAAMVGSGGLGEAESDAYLIAREADSSGAPIPGGAAARLPVYFLPRPAAAASLAGEITLGGSSGGDAAAQNPAAAAGRLDIFVPLGAMDGAEAGLDPRIDLDWVGARVRSVDGRRAVEFLIHTRGVRRVPIDSTAVVAIDIDRDGTMDKAVLNGDVGLRLTAAGPQPEANGQQGSFIGDVANHPFRILGGDRLPRYFADVELESRTIVLRADAEDLGFIPGRPVAFDAVVLHEAAFGDLAAGGGVDAVPDDGFRGGSISSGRLTFDEETLPWQARPWRLELPPGAEATIAFSATPGALPALALAAGPWNLPAEDLAASRLVAPGPPSPTATDTPPPETPSATPGTTTPATATREVATRTPATAPPSPSATPRASRTPEPSITPKPSITPEASATPRGPTPPPETAPRPGGIFRAYIPISVAPFSRR